MPRVRFEQQLLGTVLEPSVLRIGVTRSLLCDDTTHARQTNDGHTAEVDKARDATCQTHFQEAAQIFT